MDINVKHLTSIIILNYNAGNLLLDCVESIYKTTKHKFEIIVVDNISTDNSHKKCKEKFPEIRLIENKENFGYCEGNNVGIRNAMGEFVVILNPDTKVEPNWLNELFNTYELHGDGLYQPKILSFENNLFESGGNMLQVFGFGYSKGRGILDKGQFNKSCEIGYASGACLFTKTEIIKKIGLFDPFIFLYHDDLDLGWRATQLGIKSFYAPKSKIYHAGSYNYKWSAKKFYWLERNRHYCLLTHYSKKTFYKMLPAIALVEIMMIIFYISKGFIKIKFDAYKDILKNLDHIHKKYEEIESKKIISDSELIKKMPNEIFIPDQLSNGVPAKIFNKTISGLSKIVKYFI
jgi:GT2 family glycosyltransferase